MSDDPLVDIWKWKYIYQRWHDGNALFEICRICGDHNLDLSKFVSAALGRLWWEYCVTDSESDGYVKMDKIFNLDNSSFAGFSSHDAFDEVVGWPSQRNVLHDQIYFNYRIQWWVKGWPSKNA